MDRYLFSPDLPKFASRDEKAAGLLGVALNATLDDIRAAYRRRARETHPDHRADRDASGFLEVQSAYDWLTDAANRRRGDAAARTTRTLRHDSREWAAGCAVVGHALSGLSVLHSRCWS